MKKINSILSILLTLLLIVGCIPVGYMVSAESTESDVYTIFLADPSKQGIAGTDVTASSIDSNYFSTHDSVFTASSQEDGWYYHSVYSYDNVSDDDLWNRTSYFKTDKNSAADGFSWLNEHDTTLRALSDFVTVSYKVRMLQTVESGEADSNIQFYFGTANEWTLDNAYATQFDKVDITDFNVWNEFSCTPSSWGNFYSGFFGFKAEAYPNFVGTLSIDIKDIKFTIKGSDREAINNALAENGSSWTFDTLIERFTEDVSIFKADPALLGDIGTDVTATGAESGYISSYDNVYTATEEAGDFFRAVSIYDNQAEVWNRTSYFKSGYNSGTLQWLGDDTTLGALGGFIDVTFKARVNVSGADGVNVYLHTGTAQEWTEHRGYATEFGYYEISKLSEWVEYTATPSSWSNFYSGYIYFKCDIEPNFIGTATIDLKDITFTLNSGDKYAINAALAAAGSDWTYDRLVESYSNSIIKDYVLYKANPLMSGEIGAEATTAIADEESRNPVYTASEGEEAFFTYIDDYATSGQSQWNRRHYFNLGYTTSNKGYEWMGDDTVLEKLAGYITVSAKVRVTANATNGNTPAEFPIYFGLTNGDLGKEEAQNSTILSQVLTQTGVWTEIKNIPVSRLTNFYSGHGVVRCECELFDGTLTVDIKDIVLTISDKDKNSIDVALTSVGSEWTFDKLTAEKPQDDDDTTEEIEPDRYLTIWEADPTLYEDEAQVDLKVANPQAYVFAAGYKSYGYADISQEENGFYYNLNIDATEGTNGGKNTGSIIIGNVNNSSIGYGWLGNEDVLNAIAPYMHTTFEYRISSDSAVLPSDTKIVLNAANEYNANVYKLTEQALNVAESGWITVEPTASDQNKVLSGHTWYNGYLCYNIYSDIGGIADNTIIDLRNIKVVINAKDRDKINAALYNTGSGLSFDDLVCFDPSADLTDIVWYANADRANALENTSIKTDEGSYYSFDINTDSQVIVESGFDSTTENFGWLASEEYLDKMAAYFYVSFDYRAGNVSQDAVMNVSADTSGNTPFASVSLKDADKWCTYEGKISAEAFDGNWSNGDVKLTVSGLSESINIDIRDIKIGFKYIDYDNINMLVPKTSDFVNITNFLKERTYGYYDIGEEKYVDVYACMLESAEGMACDVNSDNAVNVRDLVRTKKYIAGITYLPEYISKRVDTDSSFTVDAADLVSIRRTLLTSKTKKVYNDDIIVNLDVEHPGVAGMDATYTIVATDRESGLNIDSLYEVSTNNNEVTVDGLNITVPYKVRMSDEELTVTVTYLGKSGRYTFDFQKFSTETTFKDDFDTLNSDVWTSAESEVAPFISDGALALTATTDAKIPSVASGAGFKQAYGSFSARLKTPAEGLVNSAFWLRTNGNDYIKNVRNPQWSGGEIDIVEYYSTWKDRFAASVHWNGWSAMHRYHTNDQLQGTDLAGKWHIYSAVWTPDAIYFYLDGNLAHIYEGVGVSENCGDMELVFSLGNPCKDDSWGGAFDASKLPATMYVDWVEAYALAE